MPIHGRAESWEWTFSPTLTYLGADMFAADITRAAAAILDACRSRGLRLAAAESCTGGLIAGALTAIPGSSDVFERGFVTYSNEAKAEMLGVPSPLIAAHGAVSEEVARAMAEGALAHARADIAVAVTGVAGPGGGSAAKPVGLVHIACARRGRATAHSQCRFGDIGRDAVREETVRAALSMLSDALAGQ
ncbi:MAG: CinA family protein [Hyphomonadaceae bacterium]